MNQYPSTLAVLNDDLHTRSSVAIDGYAATANFKSAPFYIGAMNDYALDISVTGTLVGTVSILGCVDRSLNNTDYPDAGQVHFYTLPFASGTIPISLNNDVVLSQVHSTTRWIQLSFAYVSGSGTITARIQVKGN